MYNNIKMWASMPGSYPAFSPISPEKTRGRDMKRQLTLQEYRTIDLALFAVILVLFEYIIVRFAIASYYTVSLAAVITSIVYMRWGWWGGLHAALGGALFCFYYSAVAPTPVLWTHYIIYPLGNLFSLAAVPALKKAGPERVRQSAAASLAFSLSVILLMQLGRGAVAVVLGVAGAREALGYVTGDAISVLFTLVVTWIVRRLDGLFEEQRHYLTRVQEERERNKNNAEQ